MKTHLDNLIGHVPDLLGGKILDLGSGKGEFIMEVKKKGGNIIGLEKNQEYIDASYAKAAALGYEMEIIKSEAEKMPFNDEAFDFINSSEVIEHVENPRKMMHEIARVLRPGGFCYLSVPNRFGFYDPHFHLYFINYLPRSAANFFISLFKRHKNYGANNGRQRLDEMHYYTFAKFEKLAMKNNLELMDIREKRIKEAVKNKFCLLIALLGYRISRFIYFGSFHLLLRRQPE